MVKNKARVEGSIANAYLVREASFFCSHYFEEHVYTRSRVVPRNDDGDCQTSNETNLSIFEITGRLQGKMQKRRLTDIELKAAHRYILLNCVEVEQFLEYVLC